MRDKDFDELKKADAKLNRLKNAPMNYIKLYREARGMTQSELADAAGVHRTTIARLETQGGRPHAYIAKPIADALDISVAELYGASPNSPYADASMFDPAKSGEYLCAFRRSGSHEYNYFIGYFDKDTGTWGFPPWMDFFGGRMPIKIRYWMKLPVVVEYAPNTP